MQLKTYFASSVEAAMVQALQDLGPDAMIVNSRRSSADHKALGEYEVVFAMAQEPPVTSPTAAGHEAPADVADPPLRERRDDSVRRLNQEVERLARQIESLGRVLRRGPTGSQAGAAIGKETEEVLEAALEAGFSEDFALASIERAAAAEGSLRFQLLQYWTRTIRTTAALGRTGHGRKIIALVGPSGVGKSSMIAKLAAQYGVAARRSCQILSLDSDRIGSTEPLRMIAGVLGAGFQILEDTSLTAALELHRKRELIFIDTPGFARDELSAAEQLASTLLEHEEIDIHLALPATMKTRDLDRTIQFFDLFRPAQLIFTRLDETVQLGSIVETSLKSGRPLSFLSTGPRIPEDFTPADGTQLVRRAFLLNSPLTRAGRPDLAHSAAA